MTGEPEAVSFLSDYVLMKEFGWTPKQIREELTDREYDAIMAVLDTLQIIQKNRDKKEKAKKRKSPGELVL